MKQTVLITGADRGLGYGLTTDLLKRGYTVFAGQYLQDWEELTELQQEYSDSLHVIHLDVANDKSVKEAVQFVQSKTDHIDLLVNNAGINHLHSHDHITDAIDYDNILHTFNVNTVGPLRMVNQFLPLLEKGQLKRLCFVSSEAGSIERSNRTEWYGYCASKSALNMMVKIMYNTLQPKGYEFRLYHPGWIKSYMRGELATEGDLTIEEAANYAIRYFIDPKKEETLQLVDYQGNRWPW